MLKKKTTIAIILTIVLSLGICVAVRADEPEFTDNQAITGSVQNASEEAESTDTGAENTDTGAENADTESPNFFDTLYEAVMAHSGEILGALTFIGSMILAYAYKRGLLPIIKTSLTSLAEAVSSIKASTDENGEYSKTLGDRQDKIENTLISLANGLDKLTEELNDTKADIGERQKMKLILSSQIDMLYTVFMSSSLPEYQKAEISEKIALMRKELED